MGEYHYTIEDIQKRTGLPASYLSRCSSQFGVLFLERGYRTNGTNNTTLFNENGALVFDRIKQLKEEGYNRPQIRRKLEEELRSKKRDTSETLPNERPNKSDTEVNGTLRLVIETLDKQHQAVLQAKDMIIVELKERQFLLTDGRSAEEVRAEWRRKRENEQARGELLSELDRLQRRWLFKKAKRQREIVKEIQDLNS